MTRCAYCLHRRGSAASTTTRTYSRIPASFLGFKVFEMAAQNHPMQAAFDIAHQLNKGGGGGIDDEEGEQENFSLGAIDPARMHPDGVRIVFELEFEIESSERATRRASAHNASSFSMTEPSWSGIDRTALHFLRFLALAYGKWEMVLSLWRYRQRSLRAL